MATSSCTHYLLCLMVCAVLVLSVQTRSPPRKRSCWNYRCRRGFVCKIIQPKCFRAPCPDAMPVCVKRIIHPIGKCPRTKSVGICVVLCRSDNDCSASQRCCGSCPRKCTTVPVVKKGQCPRFRRSGRAVRRCGRPCKHDGDCLGTWKCCKAGSCGKMCMMPTIPHWFFRLFDD